MSRSRKVLEKEEPNRSSEVENETAIERWMLRGIRTLADEIAWLARKGEPTEETREMLQDMIACLYHLSKRP